MKIQTIIILSIFILSLNFISATSISPDKIEINILVGDQTTINFTINSDENSVLKIESDNPNCVITKDIFDVTEGINNQTLTFYVPADSDLTQKICNFNFKFLDLSEPSPTIRHGGGGSSTIINKTIYVPIEVNNTVIIAENKTCTSCTNETTPTQDIPKEESRLLWLWIILVVIGVTIIIIVLIKR